MMVPSGPDVEGHVMADWGGRSGFAADDGTTPVAVAEVLARHHRRAAGLREVVAVLAAHRLLVPLLEVDADQLEGDDADPCAGQERAVAAVSLSVEEGSFGLAFTGMDALRAWRPDARPMPVAATEVAGALVREGAVGLLVDPAGPAPCRLPTPAVARLAAGGAWPDPWDDPALRQCVVAELAPALATGEVQVRLAAPPPGDDSCALVVEVRFAAGVSAGVAAERGQVIADRLSRSDLLSQVFDGVLAVRVG